MNSPTRPTGISVIAILAAIIGLLRVFAGLTVFGLGLFGAAAGILTLAPEVGMLGFLGAFAGFVVLVWGLITLYLAYGAWNLKPWAWTWLLVIAIVGIVVHLTGFRSNWFLVLLNAVVVYYLYTPPVKTAFGRT